MDFSSLKKDTVCTVLAPITANLLRLHHNSLGGEESKSNQQDKLVRLTRNGSNALALLPMIQSGVVVRASRIGYRTQIRVVKTTSHLFILIFSSP